MPGNEEIIIAAKGLTKRFGEVQAVSGVDFTVSRGELFGFLGPNGAGKTTTINMLTFPSNYHTPLPGPGEKEKVALFRYCPGASGPPSRCGREPAEPGNRRAVRQAFDALAPNQRMAIVLRYYEVNYTEIAAALETSSKAVERLLGRGRESLRTVLGNRKDFI